MAVTTYGIGDAACRAFIREATEPAPLRVTDLGSSGAESPWHYLTQADISSGPAPKKRVARAHVANLAATSLETVKRVTWLIRMSLGGHRCVALPAPNTTVDHGSTVALIYALALFGSYGLFRVTRRGTIGDRRDVLAIRRTHPRLTHRQSMLGSL